MDDSAQRPLDREQALNRILTGDVIALRGLAEGPWFDAKRKPYRLEDDAQKFELAKDVTGFANLAGGLILIPATTRFEHDGEVVDAVGDLDLSLVDAQRIRNVLADWVHPRLAGLEVRVLETSAGRGRMLIHLPPQKASDWPFVITRGDFDGRIESRAVAVCVRNGPDVRSLGAAEIHALLAAGNRSRALDELDRTRPDPPWFQPKSGVGTGTFNMHLPAGPLSAHLENSGGTDALVDQARLRTPIGEFDGGMWVQDDRTTSKLPEPSVRVPRDGYLIVQFGDGELAGLMQATGELWLSVVYRPPDREERSEYLLQLLRSGTGAGERPQWRPGQERVRELGAE